MSGTSAYSSSIPELLPQTLFEEASWPGFNQFPEFIERHFAHNAPGAIGLHVQNGYVSRCDGW